MRICDETYSLYRLTIEVPSASISTFVNKAKKEINAKYIKMNQSIENEKRTLLSDLINATREVTSKFCGSKKIVTEQEKEVDTLIRCWEKVISCGLKSTLLNNVQELFNSSSNGSMFWNFASQLLSHDDQKRFNSFKNVSICTSPRSI